MAAGHGMAGDMAVGVWAQLVAGVVYTPIDIVKERLQVLAMRSDQTTLAAMCSYWSPSGSRRIEARLRPDMRTHL